VVNRMPASVGGRWQEYREEGGSAILLKVKNNKN